MSFLHIPDLAEQYNVFNKNPLIVKKLLNYINAAREELGDDAVGKTGTGSRKAGYVSDPKPLTEYVPNYPYYMAEYDLSE